MSSRVPRRKRWSRARIASAGFAALVALALPGARASAADALYQWTDDRGNTRYTPDPDRIPVGQRASMRRLEPGMPSASAPTRAPTAPTRANAPPTTTLAPAPAIAAPSAPVPLEPPAPAPVAPLRAEPVAAAEPSAPATAAALPEPTPAPSGTPEPAPAPRATPRPTPMSDERTAASSTPAPVLAPATPTAAVEPPTTATAIPPTATAPAVAPKATAPVVAPTTTTAAVAPAATTPAVAAKTAAPTAVPDAAPLTAAEVMKEQELSAAIASDQEKLKTMLAAPALPGETALVDSAELREIARRLPELQAELRALRERQTPPAGP